MNLSWLKPKNASLAELHQQVGEARAAHQQSIEAVATAQADFDEEPSKLRGLLDAQQGERAALAHVGRAERLYADAKAKADAEERARLERRASELREQLSQEQMQRKRAPTRDAEVEALKAAIEARAKRVQVEEQFEQLEDELKRVRVKLGEPEESVYSIHSLMSPRSTPSTRDVADALENAFRNLDRHDVRQRFASAMRSYLNAL